MGKTYEPLKSHVGFTQEGIASWYGKDFHGKKTSNGETYDMHAMTAAHKTLPLGVFVKVRNMENGQETVVRLNDRGPFVKNRIIDLSYSAAKKLGVDLKGTAPVRVEALGYKADGSSGEEYTEPETYDNGNYSVQIGAFKDQQNATRLSGEMRKLHGYSEVRSAMVNGELFYRVQSKRNLTSGEIVEQVLFFERALRQTDAPSPTTNHQVTNLVLMGMGEPFANYTALLGALDRLSDPIGYNFGARRITVSTVGLVPLIERFAQERSQVNLAVSLHAATNELRASMLPINKRYPLEVLIPACRAYTDSTHRRLSFEWAMIEGVNDTPAQARALAQLITALDNGRADAALLQQLRAQAQAATVFHFQIGEATG